MSKPINVFICYKKMLEKEENGQKVKNKNQEASILSFILRQDGDRFDPWIDNSELMGGMAWETEIYRRILISDVLLVLVGPGTSKSPWVSREIALARALGISIVPLGFDLNRTEMDSELKALGIDHLQGKITKNIGLDSINAMLAELRPDLIQASMRTRVDQAQALSGLLARQKPTFAKAADNQRAETFVIKFPENTINLHIASGDLLRFRGIDVLVNSENDYMQMARFFESRTISSLLRRSGSRVHNGKYEDTIQRELDGQLQERGRPVQPGEVFITSAGGPTSELSRSKEVQYIFHVAAVQAVDSKATVIPYTDPNSIEMFTRNCLEKMLELNRALGVVSPPETEQGQLQRARAEKSSGLSKSILFPLFGTGQGGADTKDVIEPILTGITDFLGDPNNCELTNILTDIYISAFKEEDVVELSLILKKRFG